MAITKVEYYSNGQLIGERTEEPFNELQWQPTEGEHDLVAKLYEDGELAYTTPVRKHTAIDFVFIGDEPVDTSWESGAEGWTATGMWTRTSGTTPSGSTGPSSAFDGSYYYFIETSSSGTSYLTSPKWGSGPDFRYLNFAYHMYGTTISSLHLEVRNVTDDSSWEELWSEYGNQGDTWFEQKVDLEPYFGKEILIRFRGVRGTSYTGDAAVDKIRFTID